MKLDIVILAAGQGTRMQSALPKVLHPIGGRPMLAHVIATARALQPEGIHVVVGHGAGAVRSALGADDIRWVTQAEQLGTGHAVAQALDGLQPDARALVLYGDVPLVPLDELQQLLQKAGSQALGLLTACPADATGYGRILRDSEGLVTGIVEHKDASEAQRRIGEVNTGILTATVADLRGWLPVLRNDNRQREYYLTDTVAMAVADGVPVIAQLTTRAMEVQGVNDRRQQAEQERHFQRQQAARLMQAGVTLLDPERFDLRGRLSAGHDVVIDVNCVFEGEVVLGDRVHIGPGCVLKDCVLGDDSRVQANSVIEGARIGREVAIGPFARLRPGTRLADGVRIGNFVETKNADFGSHSKASHLSYIGDASVGRDANIGAGTITCNYDGVRKSKTTIGEGAFIGSNTALVAPVTVGDHATVGAGSTITRDVPDSQLGIARGKQRNIEGWQRKQPEQD